MIRSNLKNKQSYLSEKRSLRSPISSFSNWQINEKKQQTLNQSGFNDRLLNIELSLNNKLNFLRKNKIFYLQKLNELQDKLNSFPETSQNIHIQNNLQLYSNFKKTSQKQYEKYQNYLRTVLNQCYVLQEEAKLNQSKFLNQHSKNEVNWQNILQKIVYLKHCNQKIQRQIRQKVNEKALKTIRPQDFNLIQRKIQYLKKQINQEQSQRNAYETNSKRNLIQKYKKLKKQQQNQSHQKEQVNNSQFFRKYQQIQKQVNQYQSFLKEEQLNKEKLFQEIFQKKLQFKNVKKQNLIIRAILTKICNQQISL